MEPTLNDVTVDGEPEPAENITYMDISLYKAAAMGMIEEFNNFEGFELESRLTPNHNNVLHVNLANLERTSWFFNVTRSRFRRCTRSNFIQQIIDKCPSLLLQPNAKGETPLHVASRYGHSAIVKFLIKYRVKAPDGDLEKLGKDQVMAVREMLRNTDLESYTALHVAAQYGHVGVVQELLAFEDPDLPYSVNSNQETPLYIAARRGDGPLLTILLDKLKSTAHGGPHGRTILHEAAMAGEAKTTRIILKKKGNLTKETDKNGHTPLHYAAHLGHSSVVKELLKCDKSAAYVADKTSEMTPLLMAARQGHGRIVRLILLFCPDCCERVDKRCWNLLHFVAFRDSPSELRSSFYEFNNGKTLPGSIRNLMDAKDARGITPRHVFYASQSFTISAECLTNKLSNEKKEQILKLLEDIVNEEVAEAPVRSIPLLNVPADSFDKAREAHLVVAALIATVTFAAAITVPGGYKSEEGSDQGTPFLIHDAAFQAFVVTDALAFILSLSNVFIHFQMVPPFFSNPDDARSLQLAAGFLTYAVCAMVIAFSTVTYVVLKPCHGLAIASCCIGFSFFFLAFLCQLLGDKILIGFRKGKSIS